MKASDLKLGDYVLVSAFGLDKPCEIQRIKMSDEKPGYILFDLKGASSIIRVPYSKQLDYWNQTPILI